jgi:hypothetical protein
LERAALLTGDAKLSVEKVKDMLNYLLKGTRKD